MAIKVTSILKRPVLSIGMDDTVQAVERFFIQHDLSFAPVTDAGGELVGVVSAVDLLRFHSEGGDAESVSAWRLCSYRPVTVQATADISDVARAMVDRGVHHVVVEGGGQMLGIVSSLDLARLLLPQRLPAAD